MGTTTFTVRCADCGSEQFSKPEDPQPDDTITCAGCGKTATYAQIQRAALSALEDEVTRAARGIVSKG